MPFYKSRVDIIEVNKFVKEIEPTYLFIRSRNILNKIRDLFKVKLYTIRSETKKRERIVEFGNLIVLFSNFYSTNFKYTTQKIGLIRVTYDPL